MSSLKLISNFIFLCFLSCCQSSNSKYAKLPDPLEAGWEGESVCVEVINNEKMRVLKCTFPPGVGHEEHFHPEHFGYTIIGSKFRIKDEEGVREVSVPDGYDFYNSGITTHEVLNIGDTTAVFLIIEPK